MRYGREEVVEGDVDDYIVVDVDVRRYYYYVIVYVWGRGVGSSFIYLVEEVRLILKGLRGRFLWRVIERIG